MSSSQTTELQLLIDRLRQGDDSARQELINRAYPKLHRLAAKILGDSFPVLRKPPAIVNTSDLVNEAAYRLDQALKEVYPATVLDFLRLAAQRMRWILLDLVKKHGAGRGRRDPLPAEGEIPWPARAPDSDTSPEPVVLTRLHEQVERLPAAEREVVDLLIYHDLTEAETAELLGVSARTVRRRWAGAKLRLFKALQEFLPQLKETYEDVQRQP
jgi:RNA polymerase sigma factor (sigma-70 family)